MSASSKKKLRKEQNAAQLTQKQQQEKSAAKKLRTQTIAFVTVIALVIGIVAVTLAWRGINQSGILQNNTIAAVVTGHELTAVEFNYFFCDAVGDQYSSWQNTYGNYTDYYLANLYGLDATASLGSQYYNKDGGITWADHFVDAALESARTTYALYDAAVAEGFTLPEDAQEEYDGTLEVYEMYANLYGADADDILVATYGYGASMETYKQYLNVVFHAKAYANEYADSLKYDEAVFSAHEEGREHEYNSYSFASYYIGYTKFPELGTTDENKKVTYSDEQKEAALAAAKEAAESLTAATTTDELDSLIAGLSINKDNKSAISTKAEDVLYTDLNQNLREWLSDPSRKEGDTAVIASTTTTKNEDGTETTVTNGYYTLFFQSVNDNTRPLANVRHLLVAFKGGTTDSDGNKTYSDAEKNTAKTEAEKLLAEWKDGAATEESFIELVKEHSDDGSAESGGLYEDIYPDSNYVEPFLDWSLDESRKPGDTGVIETEFGYHVMFYSSDDEMTYRDYMIYTELQEADYTEWYDLLVKDAAATLKSTAFVNEDMPMASSY